MSRSERRAAKVVQQLGQPAHPFENKMKHDLSRFHPVGDQVLFEVEIETETKSGIIIPEMAQLGHAGAAAVLEQNGSTSILKQNGLPLCRVVAVGEDVKRAKVGERYLVAPQDASRIDVLIWLAPEAKLKCRVDPKPAN